MKKLAIVIGLIACTSTFANPVINSSSALWQDIAPEVNLQGRDDDLERIKSRSLVLNESGLKQLLTGSNIQGSSSRQVDSSDYQPEVELPLPDGGFIRLKAIESPMLSPEIAEQYPEIKTWKVQGVDDPLVTGRLDFTMKGFHGMLTLPNGDIIYIDPDKNNISNSLYHSLSKKENLSHFETDFNCSVHTDHSVLDDHEETVGRPPLAQLANLDLVTYDLAVAGTGEYTASQSSGAPNQSEAYASMITTINRVNQIYNRDIGVQLNIVSNATLAYTNSATDPYTNTNAGSLINENVSNLNSVVGTNNYDIGHVFAQGNLGGLAYVGAVCKTSYKAGGATGISNPSGEIFSIEYVAHEMGHQLGANHTFNSQIGNCSGGNHSSASAVEPGSGSTIMSYAGICGGDDLQTHSDAMFHSFSINEINSYTQSASGNCGTLSSTGNQDPVANAGVDANIPINTPFVLEGSATGGTTYTWDQMDTGGASSYNVDLGNNAIIRTLLPVSTTTRYIPRLSNLFSGTTTKGEILPQTVRDLNFDFVVRDNSGGIDSDAKKISVRSTSGTFSVLSHSSSQTITTGNAISVAWNVAGTNSAPISCSNVDIKLLRVGGETNDLKLNTPNDGSEQFIVPATPNLTGARIMVACSNQPFFQISTGSISVQQGSSGPDTTPPVITLNGSSSLSVLQGTTYTDAGATAFDNVDGSLSVSSSGTVNTAVPGPYTITYTATDDATNTSTKTRTVTVVADTVPPVITLNGAASINVNLGATYTDAGATAVDNADGNVNVTSSGTVNTAVEDVYVITYTATDAANNTSTKTRTVTVATVADTTPPVITLNGLSTLSILVGSSYTDAGATAVDNVDGSIAVSTTGTVNTSTPGTYTITYTATDDANNTATKIRTVIVTATPDTTAPVITLNGSATISLSQGTSYTDAGATAVDNIDGSVGVTTSGTVNTGVPGVYTITYTAMDSSSNTATKTRTITVTASLDKTPPVIQLIGATIIEIIQGSNYVEPGVTATDNVDSIVSVKVTGSVNTAVVGTYTLTYSAVDKAGNTSTKIRTVKVLKKILPDTTAPVITLNGANTISIIVGSNYIELGAVAIDDRDGEVNVVVSGVIDINKLGTYTVTYFAKDSANNTSTLTRKVIVTKVKDVVAPTITLEGSTNVTLEVGESFTDPGFEAFDDIDGVLKVVVTGEVDTSKAGTYVLTYTATDAAGNKFVKTRTITVEKSSDGGKDDDKGSSGGGSVGLFLAPLALLGLRRKKLQIK